MKKESEGKRAVKIVSDLAKNEGVSTPELLARAGVSASTWWRWKNGKSFPDKKTVIAIRSVCKNVVG